MKEAQVKASRMLTNFIGAIEGLLLESTNQLIDSQIRLEFHYDGITHPNVYKNSKKVDSNKFKDFTLNGYFIIEKFNKQIESKLKSQFSTLVYTSENQGRCVKWVITLENFIDPKPILKIAGIE